MEFAPCHHLTQPWHCDSQKTSHKTHLKRYAKKRRIFWKLRRKSSILRLPHKTIFDTFADAWEYQEEPRLPRETKLRDAGNLQKWLLLQNLPKARPYGPHANGCERLQTVANGCTTSSEHTLNPHTPRVKREPLLRIRENCYNTIKSLRLFIHHPMMVQHPPISKSTLRLIEFWWYLIWY